MIRRFEDSMCTHRITEYIRIYSNIRTSPNICCVRIRYSLWKLSEKVEQWAVLLSILLLIYIIYIIVTGHTRYSNIFGDIRWFGARIRISNHQIIESWANRQIFAVPNHWITEYRILANLSNIRLIEYRITELIRWPNIEPRFDDSIFGHRISNTSNHRIFDDSVSL